MKTLSVQYSGASFDLKQMKRILIIGSGGAGKSTLARRLGAILSLPIIHLDAHYWHEGWIESDNEQWQEKVQHLIEADYWVMDGNYSSTLDMRLKRSDTIIFLRYSRWLCLYRALKRYSKYKNRVRPDMHAGCPEKIDLEFLLWIWNYPKRNTKKLDQLLAGLKQEKHVFIFTQPAQAEDFCLDLRRACLKERMRASVQCNHQ